MDKVNIEDYVLSITATTLDEIALVEIGRIMVHYGLLVSRIREFVCHVCSHSAQFPVSISTKRALRLFPTILEVAQPRCTIEERSVARRAIENFSTAREFVERTLYTSWGAVSGTTGGIRKFARVEFRNYQGCGVRIDSRELTAADLAAVALNILKTGKILSEVFADFKEKLADDPKRFRKKLNNKLGF